ncbi:MAG TPA: hypothetical protein VFO34_00215 [Candidatus Acidoferrales bacterium]|nr:hypothetical protein [Candidatus Acidoferrales bacterium]
MGVWGAGLYSGDFASDLRSSIKAVLRLPFDAEKFVELVSELEPAAASNPQDEDHSTFWLVVADQFAQYGLQSETARAKATQIIETGADLAMLRKLGMQADGLQKRERMLQTLKQSLLSPPAAAKPRAIFKKPQSMIFSAGDVLVYPVSLGRPRQKLPARLHIVPAWKQDAWGATLILQADLAFGFLAWYRPLVLDFPPTEKPELAHVRIKEHWSLRRPGTCTSSDAKNLALERIGRFQLNTEKLNNALPGMKPGIRAALENSTIAMELAAAHHPPEAYVIRTAFPDTPEGEEKFQTTIRQLEEHQAMMAANSEKIQDSQNKRRPKIASLDGILS